MTDRGASWPAGARSPLDAGVRALLLGSLLLGGCAEPAPAPARPVVIASFYPLWEFTRQVAGSHAEVRSLVPPGVPSHDWEPSPRDVIAVQRAALFVYNGAGFEAWAQKLLEQVGEPAARVVRATEGIALLSAPTPGHAHRHEAPGASTAEPDPHVWLDPVLAQSMVENIRAGLAARDPANATAYGDNARAFVARLQALHESYEAGLAACARRDLVASHGALGYLARRYRLAVVSVAGAVPESEPSAAEIASVVRFAREHKVKYILTETLVSPRLAETVAREVGAEKLVFNPIEGVTQEEQAAGKGYLALMQDNLRTLRAALECR